MSDVLTVEDLESLKGKLEENPLLRPIFSQLVATIEALQAQNKRLVEALQNLISAHRSELRCNGKTGEESRILFQAQKALSTLPAEALEAERRREEVIRAAIALYDWQGSERLSHAGWRGLDFINAVEGVKALEGGK